jgi:hypothetical protein
MMIDLLPLAVFTARRIEMPPFTNSDGLGFQFPLSLSHWLRLTIDSFHLVIRPFKLILVGTSAEIKSVPINRDAQLGPTCGPVKVLTNSRFIRQGCSPL